MAKEELVVYCDANFAGCNRTRKSTLGGVILWNGHFVKSWSKTMSIIALSSGESELGAVVKAAAEALGIRAIMQDLGMDPNVKISIQSDATAAIGMVRRLGLGKVRHLAVGDLWIQQRVRSGDIQISKIAGTANPSDSQTKNTGPAEVQRNTEAVCWFCILGRSEIAPRRGLLANPSP